MPRKRVLGGTVVFIPGPISKLAATMDEAETDVLAYMGF
jgi:hypothetical protein